MKLGVATGAFRTAEAVCFRNAGGVSFGGFNGALGFACGVGLFFRTVGGVVRTVVVVP